MSLEALLNKSVTVYAKSSTGAKVEAYAAVATGKKVRIRPLKADDPLRESASYDYTPTDVGYSMVDTTFSNGRRIGDGTNMWQILGRPLDEGGQGHHYKMLLALVG